ncbi:DUF3037 domain-containing protein [Leuconostoc gasicomitatum]|uniref:DUF3037 domain-containing protein n=1 Tax=Leuconostoc gasicomitatum TaxID=115778 RepID=UPI001CC4C550|nr:DUF3037 domain-containing protein [Leuconostoc gasicomitatum]MBZ5968830.1 DUF3037 domain-containing protein [Leuconostoc gasicomitatum]
MAEVELLYSVLSYRPSSIRRESMNVGIVFHIPQKGYSKFISLKSRKRLETFDDEYDKNFFNIVMESLRYQFDFPKETIGGEYSRFEDREFSKIRDKDFLTSKTKYYANEFYFFNVQGISVEDNRAALQKEMRGLEGIYLYYDRPKNERVTKDEVKRLLSKQIKYNKITGIKRFPKEFIGNFDKSPIFDFQIGDSVIKVITFDYAKKGNLSKELKSVLYDIEHLDNMNKKLSFIINDEAVDEENQNLQEFKEQLKNITNDFSIIGVSRFMSQKF